SPRVRRSRCAPRASAARSNALLLRSTAARVDRCPRMVVIALRGRRAARRRYACTRRRARSAAPLNVPPLTSSPLLAAAPPCRSGPFARHGSAPAMTPRSQELHVAERQLEVAQGRRRRRVGERAVGQHGSLARE